MAKTPVRCIEYVLVHERKPKKPLDAGFSPATKPFMPRSTTSALAIEEAPLFGDIHILIEEAQRRTATAVNAELSLLYYRIGRRIHTFLLDGKRADYGKKIIRRLSQGLTAAPWQRMG